MPAKVPIQNIYPHTFTGAQGDEALRASSLSKRRGAHQRLGRRLGRKECERLESGPHPRVFFSFLICMPPSFSLLRNGPTTLWRRCEPQTVPPVSMIIS